MPRFRRNNGLDFGLVLPHVWTHPSHEGLMCNKLHRALHITLEATHCYTCNPAHRPQALVVPFPSPGFASDEGVGQPGRDSFLFNLGTCAGTDESDVGHGYDGLGKFMRSLAVEYLWEHVPANVSNKLS